MIARPSVGTAALLFGVVRDEEAPPAFVRAVHLGGAAGEPPSFLIPPPETHVPDAERADVDGTDEKAQHEARDHDAPRRKVRTTASISPRRGWGWFVAQNVMGRTSGTNDYG
jgi:hypothetical protein